LTSLNERLYRMDRMIELTQTDLPEPVAPAMRRCGVWVSSTTWTSPVISLPRTTGTSIFAFLKTSLSTISLNDTMERRSLGTSDADGVLARYGGDDAHA